MWEAVDVFDQKTGLPDFTPALAYEIDIARELLTNVLSVIPSSRTENERFDLSYVFIHIAAEHSMSILALFEAGAFSSGYALMRPALEAIYKAIWIATVAEAEAVEKARAGRDVYGTFKQLIVAIEKEHASTGWDVLLGKIKPFLRTLNEHTHTGAEQILRRLRNDDFRTPPFSFAELLRDVRTLSAATLVATLPVVSMDIGNALQRLVLEKHSWLAATQTP